MAPLGQEVGAAVAMPTRMMDTLQTKGTHQYETIGLSQEFKFGSAACDSIKQTIVQITNLPHYNTYK